MEYFAKSKNHSNTDKEKSRQIIEGLLPCLECMLEKWERDTLIQSVENTRKQEDSQKTLEEHQKEIVSCAEKFFEVYGEYFEEQQKQLILAACKIHDWGKANLIFQMKVNPKLRYELPDEFQKVSQIPHGFLSAVAVSKKDFFASFPEVGREEFDAFITAVYYHHTRKDEVDSQQIEEYCKKYYTSQIREYLDEPNKKICVTSRNHLLFRNNAITQNLGVNKSQWSKYLIIKGMLNKFDYIVSAGYQEAELYPDLHEKQLVKNILGRFGEENLRPVQKYMQKNRENNLVVVAPTGSGKTEAALLWINGEKGFYTLPLQVSSNAIYERIKKGYFYEHVSLLHSDSMAQYMKEAVEEKTDGQENYERARLLSMPLTVCTVDQLFKFVYKALGTEIFAATLKYSKIVLDEIQAYSPRVIAALITGLKTVQNMGGRFAIITATFPPVLQYFMEKYGLIRNKNYYSYNFSLESSLRRHKVKIVDDFDIEEIVKVGKVKKVLIICNTVKRAQELYSMLESEDAYLLHSRFVKKHRKQLEKMIMDFSADCESKGIWITTQIVEASLDIDFDILYTEMCPADSLLQRMGRCNRKGRYKPEDANIIAVNNRNGVGDKSVYDVILYERSLEFLKEYGERVFSESEKIEYINMVFETEALKESQYFKDIEQFLSKFSSINPLDYDKEEAEKKFRNIQSITVVPESVYQENYEVFEKSMEALKEPNINREVKMILNHLLDEFTLSLNTYGNYYPEGVDKSKVGKSFIHRARLQYDFDEMTERGRGLLLECPLDEDFIL